MDKEEAQSILNEIVNDYRAMNRASLMEFLRSPLVFQKVGPSGVEYQIEVQAFWDDPRKTDDNLRVMVSIDDGRFPHAFLPMTTDFIIKPDGSLLDE